MSEILSNRDLIMKNIQNELRNVIIDKYISMIMKLNKEKEILKELMIKKVEDNGYLSKSKTCRGQKVKIKKKNLEEEKKME